MAMSSFEQSLMGLAGPIGGGLMSSAFGGGGFFGKPERFEQHPLYNQQGMDLLSWLMSQGQQNTDFDAIRKNEINRFNTQTVPGLAERFTAMGGSGQRSSGFRQALGMAGSDLGQNLASMQSQFGLGQLGMGLRPQFENIHRPRQIGGFEQGMMNMSSMLPFLKFLL